MKKVAVITRHAIANYGSLLQAYATEELIRRLGHEPVIIDYRPKEERLPSREMLLLAGKPSWNANPVKRLAYLALRLPPAYLADARFAAERRALLTTTRCYDSLGALQSAPPEADVVMTGSDQVFGPVAGGGLDPAYALAFAPEGARRVAYAASFGKPSFFEAHRDEFAALLPRYHAVSVREDSAIAQCKQLGVPAAQVLDPTLMLDRAFWTRCEADIPDRGEYVLVYQLHNNPALSRYAVRAAREMGLPLVRLSASLHQFSRGGRFVFLPGAGSFLAHVRRARCVITDSFHATAFSINYGTPFVNVLSPEQNTDRLTSLLRLTGLTGRLAASVEDTALAAAPVDFTAAHAALECARESSRQWLREAISPTDRS